MGSLVVDMVERMLFLLDFGRDGLVVGLPECLGDFVAGLEVAKVTEGEVVGGVVLGLVDGDGNVSKVVLLVHAGGEGAMRLFDGGGG